MKARKQMIYATAFILSCMIAFLINFKEGDRIGVEAGTVTASGSAIVKTEALYTSEELIVTSVEPVYYGVLKKETDTTIKPAELVEAAKDSTKPNTYCIDLSTVSPSKVTYIGLATTTVADSSGNVPVIGVKIGAYQKKLVFNLQWGAEGAGASGYNVIHDLVVTQYDGKTVTYDHNNSALSDTHVLLTPANIDVEYRKGANCTWMKLKDLTAVQWDAMVKSGAIIYMRIAAANETSTTEGQRYSKETKIKMSITKATALKLDVSKLTVAMKNGVQFRLVRDDGTKADWQTVLPYNGKSTVEKAIRVPSGSAIFDPYAESTSLKVTALGLEDIRRAVGVTSTGAFTIETRIAATTKKPAAKAATLFIPMQAEAPSASVSLSKDSYVVGNIAPAAGDLMGPGYEYFLIKKNDLDAKLVDLANVKWASIKSGSELKKTVKSQYTTTTNQRTEVYASGADTVLLIRRKGTAGSAKAKAILASKYIALELSKATSMTPTPSPSPSPSPSATPSPSPAPTT